MVRPCAWLGGIDVGWSRFSLRHPVPVTVFFLIVVVLGLVSFTRLPVELYPAMDFPIAVVVADYEGAGPQEMEALVTRPLEEIMGTIGGVKAVRSLSREGSALVIVEFDWGTNMDFAALEMREKVDTVRTFLPEGAEQPRVFKIDPQAMPVVIIGLTGRDDMAALRQLAEDQIKPGLERLDGVASVSVQGGLDREINVVVDPGRLVVYGFSLGQIIDALRADNLNLPGGQVAEGGMNLLVRSLGQFQSVGEIAELRLIGPGGNLHRLGDLAEVWDTFADVTDKAWVDGRPAVFLSVQKQSGGNTVRVARAVQAELQQLTARLPGDVRAEVLQDQSTYIESSMSRVASAAGLGGIFALAVLYLFLRHFRATLAVGLAIPISLIGTFAVLFFAGVSLNIMSMGGLALGIGMLVDNAIVVLENIFRHRQEGKDAPTAASEGAGEVTLAVAAATLTTVVVFLPIVFVEGLAKQFFQELALTVAFALLVSLVVSLTLIPLAAARLLSGGRSGRVRIPQPGRRWQSFADRYGAVLRLALRRRLITMLVALGCLGGAAALVPHIGTEFIPAMDTGLFRVVVELPSGSRFEETEKVVQRAEAIVRQLPEVSAVFSMVGADAGDMDGGGQAISHRGSVYGKLAPRRQRARSLDDVMEEVRRQLEGQPGVRVRVEASGALGPGGDPVEVRIIGDDLEVLEQLALQVRDEMRRVPGIREVESSVTMQLPELQVRVDRLKAAEHGLTPVQVAALVRSAVSGRVATQYRVGGEEVNIRVRATAAARADADALRSLPLITPRGGHVLLGDIAELHTGAGPLAINRSEQARVVTVRAGLYGRDLGRTMSDVREQLAAVPLPPGYALDYGGQNEQMEEAFGGLLLALGLAAVLIYLVMAAQFESYLYPLTIMVSVPLAFVGSIAALALTGRSVDIAGLIGVIMLVGIVVNNAILLVSYINILRGRGMARDEAVLQAGPTRLRPVLMTALTTILGLLPLALGMGEGTELQAPLATVVIGGLTLSTLLTLVVIPVMYTLLDDLMCRLSRGRTTVVK